MRSAMDSLCHRLPLPKTFTLRRTLLPSLVGVSRDKVDLADNLLMRDLALVLDPMDSRF